MVRLRQAKHVGALLIAAAPFLCAALPVGAQTPPPAAQAETAPLVEPSYATALIRDVLAAVNQGNWTGNYTVLRDYAAPEFGAANDPTRLAGLFTELRVQRLDLLRVMVTDPVLLSADLAEQGTQMRLTGYFPLQPMHVSFDLTFLRERTRWLLTGISVGAFEPIN